MAPRPSRKHTAVGRWRITRMDVWERDYLDLVVTAHITLGADGLGSFQFGTVEGFIDYRASLAPEGARVEFSWQGSSDGDPSCGRGWATVHDERMEGRLFIHDGDDSAFVAERAPPHSPPGHRSGRRVTSG